MVRAVFLFYFLLFAITTSVRADSSDERHDYISRLLQAVREWRQEIPALDASAAKAAKSLILGGHLYISGPQLSLVQEVLSRSGGLVLSLPLTDNVRLQPNDVVISGATQADNPKILDALRHKANAIGAQLIIFSSGIRPADSRLTLFPVKPVPDTNYPSVESTSNVAGLWAWTGELIQQCIASGKSPCIYESMFMPGGLARDKVIQSYPFHALTITPGPNFPSLGSDYIEALYTALVQLREKNALAFQQAAGLLIHTHSAGRSVVVFSIGHMFPAEFTSNPVPSWITPASNGSVPDTNTLPFYLGYQWFPWEYPGLSGPKSMPSIIVTSRHPTLDWQADKTHIYIDPCWEVEDATIEIPGYDVKALPASGVLESAIFWELLERL